MGLALGFPDPEILEGTSNPAGVSAYFGQTMLSRVQDWRKMAFET